MFYDIFVDVDPQFQFVSSLSSILFKLKFWYNSRLVNVLSQCFIPQLLSILSQSFLAPPVCVHHEKLLVEAADDVVDRRKIRLAILMAALELQSRDCELTL